MAQIDHQKWTSSISSQEFRALETLKDNLQLVIRKADKGGAIFLMDVEAYETEMFRQLSVTTDYIELDSDPTPLQDTIKALTLDALEGRIFTRQEFLFLNIDQPLIPVIYLLPKLHKTSSNPPEGRLSQHLQQTTFIKAFKNRVVPDTVLFDLPLQSGGMLDSAPISWYMLLKNFPFVVHTEGASTAPWLAPLCPTLFATLHSILTGGRQCSSNPCMNNGKCEDTIRSYTCSCPENYNGNNCQFAMNECYPQMSEGCQHFCSPDYNSYRCSCAKGYDLAEDDKSCLPTDPYTCGRVLAPDGNMETNTTSAKQTLQNRFPWQVLLRNAEEKDFCSGVILNQKFVLTTATCAQINKPSSVKVVAGKIQDHEPVFTKQIIQVKNIHVYMRYSAETGENNIALLQLHRNLNFNDYCLPICIPERDFAEYVLMPENSGTVSSWKLQEEGQLEGSLIQFQVSPLEKETCESILNITQTNRVFCGISQEILKGHLAGGSHFAVEHKGTWFLIGILGSCPSELSNLETFVFTKISRYVTWLHKAME
uniref:Vitamin K-dependent protein Z n=1 Tax=Geotrypetes seraphini TaxID=260995 RepID=A0A6P8RJ45_GEOSA|nr:vitamin K-dependent protein Z [Geotrypetes seraphini]